MNGNIQSVKETMHNGIPEIDLTTNDDEQNNWSESTEPYNFDEMKIEFDLLPNTSLLTDYPSLLEDGEDDVLLAVNTSLEQNITNECAALVKQRKIERNGVMGIEGMDGVSTSNATAKLENKNDADEMSTTNNGNDSFLSHHSGEERLSQSLCIGSIMSDHDYLSRENTLEIVGYDEDKCCQRQAEHEALLSPKATENTNESVEPEKVVVATSAVNEDTDKDSDQSRRNSIGEDDLSMDLIDLVTRLSTSNDLNLVTKAEEKLKLLKEKCARKCETQKKHISEVSEAKTDKTNLFDNNSNGKQTTVDFGVAGNHVAANSRSSQLRKNTEIIESASYDSSLVFSHGHSEPLECYDESNVNGDNFLEDPDNEEGKEFSRKCCDELRKFKSFATNLTLEITKLEDKLKLYTKLSPKDIGERVSTFIKNQELDFSNSTKEFNGSLKRLLASYNVKCDTAAITSINEEIDQSGGGSRNTASHVDAAISEDLEEGMSKEAECHEKPNSSEQESEIKISTKRLNQKQKERWLADSSESSAAEADDSDDSFIIRQRPRKKNKRRLLSTESNGSPDDNTDCEETDVLVKNEPVFESPKKLDADELLTKENTVNENSANPPKPSQTSKKTEVDENMEVEDEFYGFDDSLQNTSLIEIGVKTEFLSQSEVDGEKNTSMNKSDPTNDEIVLVTTQSHIEDNDDATQDLDFDDVEMLSRLQQINTVDGSNQKSENGKVSDENKENEGAITTRNFYEQATQIFNENEFIETLPEKLFESDEHETKQNGETSKETLVGNKIEKDSTMDTQVSTGSPKTHKDEVLKQNKMEKIKETSSATSEDEDDPNGFEDTDADADEEDADSDDRNDKEIERLCDFSSLGIKRKNPDAHVSSIRANGTITDSKKAPKKQKKDELLDIIEKSKQATLESDSSSESDDDFMSEEQFLKEENLNMKNQLLQDSDSDNDDDLTTNELKVNGEHKKDVGSSSNSEEDTDKTTATESEDSLLDNFLVNKIKETEASSSGMKSKEKKEEERVETESDEETETVTHKDTERKGDSEQDEDDEDDDEERSLSDRSDISKSPKRIKKSQIGKNIFGNVDKDLDILVPTDDENDLSEDENNLSSKSKKNKDKSKTNKTSADNSDCEILDTSMFRVGKNVKKLDGKQLAKILNSGARTKQPTSREIPDDCIELSSDDDLDLEPIAAKEEKEGADDDEDNNSKRNGRRLLRNDQLAGETKQAQREEQDRVKRLEKKKERLSEIIQSQRINSQSQGEEVLEEVILDFDTKKDENIVLHADILKQLKPHQIDGIKFMYDCCYGSVDTIDKFEGSGCILAHCMGLGKTLQLIALLHTVINYPQLKTSKVLVICPKSTVMNWKEEIEKWLSPIRNTRKLKLYHFPDSSNMKTKIQTLKEWHSSGKDNYKPAGCLIIGYEAFRTLVVYHQTKKSKATYNQDVLDKFRRNVEDYLLQPGADLCICDEGHMIKNQKSATSLAVNQICTKRRIILTGTPIQNNLKEYYSMVNFIKPSFLGTEKEFANLYVNPIKNGQHKDSSSREIKHMKQRSYVLHKKLSKFVQRREAALLKTFLPEKYEYVLFIPMTDTQNTLYQYFLENNPLKELLGGKSLIPDYTALRKIWTHPKVLENAYKNAIEKQRKEPPKAKKPQADSEDEQPDDVLDSQIGRMAVTSDWWRPLITDEDLETILPSNKLKILFEILNICKKNGEKCLIFSAFVAVLDVVEYFMKQIQEKEEDLSGKRYPGLETYEGPWVLGKDYYRLDGKTPKSYRHTMIKNFNENSKTRAFLISAKAGGQGINLIGANRVILLDTSWNPSNDQQNIFRVFRLGQKKVCYIYRLLAMGTMEEKVYSRSVTKQAMSCRVVDEQQIDRHYNMAELTELYTLTKPDFSQRPTPSLPVDTLLAHLVHNFPRIVYKYHEHDSLLENTNEQELSEQEKEDAWAAYEHDVKMKNTMSNNMGIYGDQLQMASAYNNLSTAYGMYNAYASNYNPQYNPFYNQLAAAYSATPNLDLENEFLRHLYGNPYGSYNSLYGTGSTSPATANMFGNSSLLPSSPPSVSSSSSVMAFNALSSRSMMQQNQSTSSSLYNHGNNYLSSTGQPTMLSGAGATSNSKVGYNMPLMSPTTMQMLFNSTFNGGNSGGSLTTLQQPSNSTSTVNSKSTPLISSPPSMSLLDAFPYLQSMSSSSTSSSSNSLHSTTITQAPQQQGPNAKRNPMLSKELSIPSLMPSRNPFVPTSLPSVKTSVITATTVASSTTTTASSSIPATNSTTTTSVTKLNNTNNNNSNNNVRPSSNYRDIVIKDSIDAQKRKNSPEPQIISVKNVNAINKSVAQTISTSKNNVSELKKNDAIEKIQKQPGKNTPIAQQNSSNIGISYPNKNRTDTNKLSNSPVSLKAKNMGIVYPSASATKADTSTSKNAQQHPTALETVNRVLQKQNDKRAFANVSTSSSPISISPSTTNSPQIVRKNPLLNPLPRSNPLLHQLPSSKQAVNTLAKNKSLTVFQTTKPATNQSPKPSNVNSSITLSPITSASNPAGSNKTFNTPLIRSTPGVLSKVPSNPAINIRSDMKTKTVVPSVPKVLVSKSQYIGKNNAAVQLPSTQHKIQIKPSAVPTSVSFTNSLTTTARNINAPPLIRLPANTNAVQTTKLNTAINKLSSLQTGTGTGSVKISSLSPSTATAATSTTLPINRKRGAPPLALQPNINGLIGSNSLSITQVKKPKLSLNKTSSPQQQQQQHQQQTTPFRMIPLNKKSNVFQNVHIVPNAQSTGGNKNTSKQSPKKSQQPVEIVELD